MPKKSLLDPESITEATSLTLSDLRDLLPDWQTMLRAENLSLATRQNYDRGVDHFLRWAESTGVERLTKTAVRAWVADMLEVRGYAGNTTAIRLAGMRSLTKYLHAEGDIEFNILYDVKVGKFAQRMVSDVSEEDLKLLIKACQGPRFTDKRDEAMVRLLAETGLRASELISIRVEDVDRSNEIIRVLGKGNKERFVRIGPKTAVAITRYLKLRRQHKLADLPDLWLGGPCRGRGTFGYSAMWAALRRRARSVGIENFHPHKLRHTFANRWLEANGSETGLMTAAGWTNLKMVQRYTATRAAAHSMAEARSLNLGNI